MTMTIRTSALLSVALVAGVTSAARADDTAAAKKALETVNPVVNWLQAMRTEAGATDGAAGRPSEKACHDAAAAARKAGLEDDAKLYADGLLTLDDAKYDDQHQPYLALGDLDALCTEYGKWILIVPAAAAQATALQQASFYATQDASSYPAATGKELLATSKTCRETTQKAIAAGAPDDWKTTEHGTQLTLAEGLDQACKALEDIAAKWGVETGGQDRANEAAIRDRYKALGVAGARLDLYVQNDNTYWLGKGCQKITDPKRLVKAKVLFQWWDAADGTITIRKYTFAGNAVKSVTNKTYALPDKAQRGCK